MRRVIFGLAAAVLLAGCDQDPFGATTRTVRGGFQLKWFETSRYYLVSSGAPVEVGGVLDGAVERIGWNDRYILALRQSMRGAGPERWMIADVRSGAVSGPFSNAQVAADVRVRDIRPLAAHQAFDQLGQTPLSFLLRFVLPLAAVLFILRVLARRQRATSAVPQEGRAVG